VAFLGFNVEVFAVLVFLFLFFLLPVASVTLSLLAFRRRADLEKRFQELENSIHQVLVRMSLLEERLAACDNALKAVGKSAADQRIKEAVSGLSVEPDLSPPGVTEPALPQEQEANKEHLEATPTGVSRISFRPFGEEPQESERVMAPPVLIPAEKPAPSVRFDEAEESKASALEERIGVTWLTRLGAAVLILGVAYFFKYVVDNRWIGPWGRIALGALVGVAILAFAERIRSRAKPAYVQGVVGVGLACLYVAGYAAYGFYALVPLPLAFLSLTVVSALGAAEAIRHRSQVILVLALGAAFANPVLLSTDVDRPLALFSYLFAVTSVAIAVSLRLGFRVPLWLAVTGVLSLSALWYQKFFHFHPPTLDPVEGTPVPDSAGPYYPLRARLVPVAFAALFAAQWVIAGLSAKKRRWQDETPTALQVAGLLLVHLASGFLLGDRPELVAAALAGCAAAAVLTFRQERELPLVAGSVVVAFFVLVTRADVARDRPMLLLVLAALWLSVYAGTMVWRVHGAVRASSKASELAVGTLGLTWLAAVVLTGVVLLPKHPAIFAGLLVPLALAIAGLGLWLQQAWVALAGLVVSLLGLSVAVLEGRLFPEVSRIDGDFFLLAALWGAVYLAAGAYALLVRRLPADAATVLVTAGGPVGFVADLLASTDDAESGLRALASGGAGLVLFGLGVSLLWRRPEIRHAATALLGCGWGLLALAVGLAFSGVTVTLVWALMGTVVVFLAARTGEEPWFRGGLVLLGIALLRALGVDAQEPARMAEQFARTLGAEGALQPPLLLNPRALAFAGVAAALLGSAFLVLRAPSKVASRAVTGTLAGVGYALLLLLVVSEAQRLVTHLPEPPASRLDREEFTAFMAEVKRVEAELAARRSMAVTLSMAAVGSLLLFGGVSFRSAFHRWLGLIVLGLTVGKLVLWDIWKLPRLYQVLVLIVVGALLLGAGFLYARFGNRFLRFLRNAAAIWVVFLNASPLDASEKERYRYLTVLEVPAQGLARFEVTPELYRLSATGSRLADLRILTSDGREVPWFLRDVPAPESPAELPAELLDPVVLEGGASRATFDLGSGDYRHSEVELDVEGRDFLRAVVVEASEDGRSWGTLGRGFVLAASAPEERLESKVVRYPVSRARYVRVTLEGISGKEPVRIQGGKFRHRSPEAVEPTGKIELRILRFEPDRERRHTVLVADAGAPGVPLQAIVLEILESRFERRVKIDASNQPGSGCPFAVAWFSKRERRAICGCRF
jgi:hypothetical protein